MAVYVVRHAKAGDREAWEGDDRLRPLTKSGRRQAEELVERFANDRIDGIQSSPYVRCVQTVEPLAKARGLRVESNPELEEGKGPKPIMRLLERASGRNLVLCTHGDIVDDLLGELIKQGLVTRAKASNEKGGTWVLEGQRGVVSGAQYRPAP